MNNLLTPDDIRNATELIIKKADEIIPTQLVRELVSEWAEKKRVLPEGLTPYPGPFSWDVVPYMKEIADCLSESSPVREVAVLKGSQIAATVGLGENWIGYVIDSSPGPMMYVNGNAEMAGPQMELRIDAMINHAGIGHKIKSQSKRATQRKTGDVKTRKEFPGGWLMAGGPKSSMIKRSFSAKYIYADEIDSWPETSGNEGDPVGLLRQRKKAFAVNYKILWTSTPLFEHSSHILDLYSAGDKRKYHVPCKHCGHMQFLKWENLKFSKDEHGLLIHETDKSGDVITSSTVRYECEECGGEWKDRDKDYFLPRGEWRPTQKSTMPGLRSYHVPGLLSPVGFSSWEDGVIEFLAAERENDRYKMQIWVNNFLGEAFTDQSESIKPELLLTRTRRYHVGTLPEDARPLFITIGADVQADRVECEIVAWGKDKESWSIDYLIFSGDTSEIDNECWEDFREVIKARHAGLPVLLTGVDAGYRTDVVYQFADSFEAGVHPVMGNDNLSKGKDYIKTWDVKGRSVPRIDINTDLLKQEIYRLLNKGEQESGYVPKGYCHFPIEYKREHYNRLTAEQRVYDGKRYIWDKGSRRNEQLDCRVYALAMLYAYRQYVEDIIKIDMKRTQPDQARVYTLPWSGFWEYVGGE